MEQTISIKTILGCDVRSRSNVERLKNCMCDKYSYVFDMQDVTFISRSVADEFCNLADELSVRFINTSEFVDNMLQVVLAGRNKHRQRDTKDAQIIECKDMESLSAILVNFV